MHRDSGKPATRERSEWSGQPVACRRALRKRHGSLKRNLGKSGKDRAHETYQQTWRSTQPVSFMCSFKLQWFETGLRTGDLGRTIVDWLIYAIWVMLWHGRNSGGDIKCNQGTERHEEVDGRVGQNFAKSQVFKEPRAVFKFF